MAGRARSSRRFSLRTSAQQQAHSTLLHGASSCTATVGGEEAGEVLVAGEEAARSGEGAVATAAEEAGVEVPVEPG